MSSSTFVTLPDSIGRLRREAAEFDSENRFRLGCEEGREQEAEEELERERGDIVAMAEHDGELATGAPRALHYHRSHQHCRNKRCCNSG
ncbi:hypothetical protein ACFX15_046033 [Malus domestica]